MKCVRLVVAVGLLVLGVAACGGSDEGADDGDQSGVTIQTDDGDVSIEGGSGDGDVTVNVDDGELDISGSDDGADVTIVVDSDDGSATSTGGESVPDGFPVSIHPDCSVVSSTTIQAPDGEMMMVTVEMPVDKAEEIADFYEEAFEDMGMMVMRTAGSSAEGSMIMLTGVDEDGDGGASCMVSIADDMATAVISIGGDV